MVTIRPWASARIEAKSFRMLSMEWPRMFLRWDRPTAHRAWRAAAPDHDGRCPRMGSHNGKSINHLHLAKHEPRRGDNALGARRRREVIGPLNSADIIDKIYYGNLDTDSSMISLTARPVSTHGVLGTVHPRQGVRAVQDLTERGACGAFEPAQTCEPLINLSTQGPNRR